MPALAADYASWSGGIGETLLIVAKEAFVGMTMGFIVALPFWIFEAAGFVIDNQRGASLGSTPESGHGQ